MTTVKTYKQIRCPYCNAVFFDIADDATAIIRIKCRKCHNFCQVEVFATADNSKTATIFTMKGETPCKG